ncbi:endolytic transglycosylase MltG [Candidatus Shapirobacteria bacterium]|nr:endolytic transglycosylase MltG [Candidatus Shapirobacteria bacterium]HQI13122.1 endolytic transglycosylase MltG [Candidatus Woesebacteria bacterium]
MKKFVLLPLIVILAILALFLCLYSRPAGTSQNKKAFVINQGDSLVDIATRLEKNHLIKNRYAFIFFSYAKGLNKKLQSGTFYLYDSMNLSQMIDRISKGGSTDYWLKIIPGSRIEEFAPDTSFVISATGLEGRFYPDSYLIPKYFTHQQIIQLITDNFNKKIIEASKSATTTLDDKNTLILASLLEREAKGLDDKKIVAGILLNRLHLAMPLQVDASVQYAKDSLLKPEKYWQPITREDLKIDSPYNTYKNSGLPPSPICNPGLNSLIAAYHPSPTDYIYYIHDTTGQIHYAKTLDEHNANVAKYLR